MISLQQYFLFQLQQETRQGEQNPTVSKRREIQEHDITEKIYTVQGWFSELISNAEKSRVFLPVDLHSDFVHTYIDVSYISFFCITIVNTTFILC